MTLLNRSDVRVATTLATVAVIFLHSQASAGDPRWRFTDVTTAAGAMVSHLTDVTPGTLTQRAGGGVAAGDYDRDGDVDLYVIGGPLGTNALLRNSGRGTFEDVADAAGVALSQVNGSGPLFFDFDGDGWLDLFVGATDGDAPVLFRNTGTGKFEVVTRQMGLSQLGGAVSATAGDYDRDGWLDLFLSHWQGESGSCHLFRNHEGRRFECVDAAAGIPEFGSGLVDLSFTANFVDLDRDGWQDLVVTGDFGTSRVLRNHGGQFEPWSSPVISDENGMGSAIGDYDGDGTLDWFVTSIWDGDGVAEGDWGTTGNRLYRGLGDGTFEDATDRAGVRQGDWGWAACFADLDQDGVLDLVHVNGWPQGSPQFRNTPARLFVGNADGVFSERAAELGFDERNGGRGLVCFDADGDGDVDLFVMNNAGPTRLWRNDGATALGNHLSVKLEGNAPNTEGIGAVVVATAAGRRQVREIRAGSNYVSQDPAMAHFGLGSAVVVDTLSVDWPSGQSSTLTHVAANQTVAIPEPKPRAPGCSVALGLR